MTTFHLEQRPAGHDHGVQLDDTFDFINTLENDANDGTPNEHLPSARAGGAVVRGARADPR